MKKKIITLLVVILLSMIGYFLYIDIQESKFTGADILVEQKLSEAATTKSDEIVKVINNIPADKEILNYTKDAGENDCGYSRKRKKSGSKSRFCEKKIIAYVGINQADSEAVTNHLKKALLSRTLDFDLDTARVITRQGLEDSLMWSSRGGGNLKIKYQTADKSDLTDDKAKALLNTFDIVLDIYYYHKYSEITKPINIFEYF